MSLPPFVAWGFAAVAAALATVFAASQARKLLRRRARRLRGEALAWHREVLSATQAPAVPAIAPERVAAISTDAQQAAWRVARQAQPDASNPHPARTREFVLWEATFHSALSDFTELAQEVPPPEMRTREP